LRKIKFYKYHGTGNDFIMIDNRSQKVVFDSPEMIAALCHRRFGIGADGLILLEESGSFDFKMKYYNSDGNEGSMCGNGGRCIVAFAHFLGVISGKTTFEAVDGLHEAELSGTEENIPVVSLKMNDVSEVIHENGASILNTGSPHYVIFCEDAESVEVVTEGKKIRYSPKYMTDGINVNFVSVKDDFFSIRTYERGVEDETFSCGTGTVAAALALESQGKTNGKELVKFETKGGFLEVSFKKTGNLYSDIHLIGPAEQVYDGSFELQ